MFDPPSWGTKWNTCQDRVGWYKTSTLEKSDCPAPPPVLPVNPHVLLERLKQQRVTAHPDKGGTAEEFIRVNREYESLKAKLGV